MSRLKEIAEEEFEMEMTPMIDVTFLLLIFFLCTLRFKTLEGKLAAYLPKDVGVNTSEAEPKEKIEIMLKVKTEGRRVDPLDSSLPWSGEGRYEYVGRVVRYSIGPKETQDIKTLKSRLKKLYDTDDPTDRRPVTIDSRPGTAYGDVVPVLDVAIEVGYEDITFVGEYKQ